MYSVAVCIRGNLSRVEALKLDIVTTAVCYSCWRDIDLRTDRDENLASKDMRLLAGFEGHVAARVGRYCGAGSIA